MRTAIDDVSSAAFLTEVSAIVGEKAVFTERTVTEPYLSDWRQRYSGAALAVTFPSDTAQVARLVQLCATRDIAIVPQAGNTGMTGGAIPLPHRPSLLVNVSKMNKIREIDARNRTVVAEAGCILDNLADSVREYGKLFPMALGSSGSCQVGGLVSTNAGGTGVLRYGNMRELVLGLEVVLPDGEVWNGLSTLRKDNTGYDLKQLFIGAEGTLGIVTAASLKLFPLNLSSGTAMVALSRPDEALDLLNAFVETIGNRVEAFEIMSKAQLETVIKHFDRPAPLPISAPWFAMIEIADTKPDWNVSEQFETILSAASERGLISDAIIAQDLQKARSIWELRHRISEANKRLGFSVANDTSVPVSKVGAFIDIVDARLRRAFEAAHIFHCGHIGDGNIHVIIVFDRVVYDTPDKCASVADEANLIVHQASVELGGSISAEHGIGIMHVAELERFTPAIEMKLMSAIKRTFDPSGIMNPGKILRS